MSGLRETKKAATRNAIADAAAQILLTEGYESFTVATIAKAAGVSTRTFHNYFTGLDKALLAFIETTIVEEAEQVKRFPAELDTVDIVEDLVVSGVRAEEPPIRSITSLFLVADTAAHHGGLGGPPPSKEEANALVNPLLKAFTERTTEDVFSVEVKVRVAAAAGLMAVEKFLSLPEPQDKEVGTQMVRQAFSILRSC